VEFRAVAPPACAISERPLVNRLTRWQIEHGNLVTSQFHLPVKIEDEIGRCLLTSMDGTLDRHALLEKIWQLLTSKNPLNARDQDQSDLRRQVEADLDRNLDKLARLGLLAG
jgi:hypothetical protein